MMEEYPQEPWNPYASPTPVDDFSLPELNDFQEGLMNVRSGIGWVLLGLLMSPAAAFLSGITEGMLGWPSFITLAAVQLAGMRKCLEYPEDVASYGRGLIYASGGFYLACFLLLFLAYLAGPPGSERLGILGLACLGFSGVVWQIFLIRLAQGLESQGLADATGCMLGVYVLGGFTMLILSLSVIWMADTSAVLCIPVAMLAGFIYGVMYLAVLIGMRARIVKIVRSS